MQVLSQMTTGELAQELATVGAIVRAQSPEPTVLEVEALIVARIEFDGPRTCAWLGGVVRAVVRQMRRK